MFRNHLKIAFRSLRQNASVSLIRVVAGVALFPLDKWRLYGDFKHGEEGRRRHQIASDFWSHRFIVLIIACI